MIAQLPQDFVHLEGSQDGLDQNCSANGAARNAESVLRKIEGIVPQARFQATLHLGQVEVRPSPARRQSLGVVEEVQTEIEQGARDLGPIDEEMLLVQMPAARAHQQRRDLVVQLVGFSFGAFEGDGAADGVAEIHVAVEIVGPGGRVGVLEVGHEDAGAGVERVDDHLAVHRAGDLDAAVGQVLGDGRDGPFLLADGCGFGEKIGQCAGVELLLADLAARQKFLAARFERDRELCKKLAGFARENLGVAALDGAADLSASFGNSRLLSTHNHHGRSMT